MRINFPFHPHHEGWGYALSLWQPERWSGACWLSLGLFPVYRGTG